MLRPATPLAIALFAAFVMLLLSVLSTPIISAIPLGEYKDVTFGVFGFCQPSGCSPIAIGYDISAPLSAADDATFDIDDGTRSTLTAILIVHPVACLLTLIMFAMAVASHFHAASHSSRYLLVLLIFGILTFLVCLLCFLIDVLLFVPHMAWGSYIVLAATVLVFMSFIVSCAMRRTLVSRKARKKRIAENAEMSGENYYNRQGSADAATAAAEALAPTVPAVSSKASEPQDSLPTFASYEQQKKDDQVSDERVPLTTRTPSERSNNMPNTNGAELSYNQPPSRSGSRDQFGNPQDPYGIRRGPSVESMGSRGRGPPPGGYRGPARGGYGRGGYGGPYGPPPGGRGGYGPPARGAYGPGPQGRGGYGPPPRGAYAMRGGRPPPPPGYPAAGPYGRGPPPANAYGNYGPERQAFPDRQMSPGPQGAGAPYAPNPSMPSVTAAVLETGGTGGYEAYHPDRASDLPRAESPPPLPDYGSGGEVPVGQAIEMDATTGSPAHPPQGFGDFNHNRDTNHTIDSSNNSNNNIRDSDTDVAGMLALQEGRSFPVQRHNTVMSEESQYSQDDGHYVPPRAAWNQGAGRSSPMAPSPLSIKPPQEMADTSTPPPPQPVSSVGNSYYEDVDPRFTEQASRPMPGPLPDEQVHYDDPHSAPGARSPAISERSGFTSVSQRSVNPRWNPHMAQGYGHQMPPRRPTGRNEVNVLNSNPDFQLPSSRGGGNRPPGTERGAMIPGSSYPGI